MEYLFRSNVIMHRALDQHAVQKLLDQYGRLQLMTFGGSGALNDYHGRGHHVFGMHSHVTLIRHTCTHGASLAVREAPVAQ